MKAKRRLLCLFLALSLLFGQALALEDKESINWYEVFVYSYADSNGDGIGDLQGLKGKLDYIADLGFDGLWLMPIMPSPSYHKYDVTNYLDIDTQYGDLADMKGLVSAARQLGIKIIIDLPVNHSSTLHPWFLSAVTAIKAGEMDNPYINYYNFSQNPGDKMVPLPGTGWYYEEQFSGGGMPDLNLDNAAIREEIRLILAFWLNEMGVDGFRLDAVTSFYAGNDPKNIDFLRFLKDTTEGLKPGSFLVGECWKGLSQIADYYASGMDSFFLFPASQAEGYIAAALRARRPAEHYAISLGKVEDALSGQLLTPFLSNHDTGRTVGLVQGRQAPDRIKLAHALLALMGGYTFTYYGEEIGMAGAGEDPNKRLAMDWGDVPKTQQPPGVTREEYPFPPANAQQEDPQSILNYVKALNHLRLRHPEIALGQTSVVLADGHALLLQKTGAQQTLYVACNLSLKEALEISLPLQLTAVDSLLMGEDPATFTGETSLLLPPGSLVLLTP